MQHDTRAPRQRLPMSDTALARLLELEARAAEARWQAGAGIAGSSFIAEQAERLQNSINAQLDGARTGGRPQQS